MSEHRVDRQCGRHGEEHAVELSALLEALFLIQRLSCRGGLPWGSRVARQAQSILSMPCVMACSRLTPEKIPKSDPAVLTDYGL